MKQGLVKYLFFLTGLVALAGSFMRIEVDIPEFLAISPDKTKHILLAMILIILMQLAYRKLNIFFTAMLLFIGSISVEFLQHLLTTTRSFDLKDIYANLIGLTLGVIIIKLFGLIRRNQSD